MVGDTAWFPRSGTVSVTGELATVSIGAGVAESVWLPAVAAVAADEGGNVLVTAAAFTVRGTVSVTGA